MTSKNSTQRDIEQNERDKAKRQAELDNEIMTPEQIAEYEAELERERASKEAGTAERSRLDALAQDAEVSRLTRVTVERDRIALENAAIVHDGETVKMVEP